MHDKNMRAKRKYVLSFVLAVLLTFVYFEFFYYVCHDVDDIEYSAPHVFTQKWIIEPINPLDAKLSYSKFPHRNAKDINDKLERFGQLFHAVNDYLLQKTSSEEFNDFEVTKIDSKTGKKLYKGTDASYLITEILTDTKTVTEEFPKLQQLLEKNYYNSTATNCTDMEVRGISMGKRIIRNPGCHDDPSKTLQPNSLGIGLVQRSKTYISNEQLIPVTYVQVFKNAFVEHETGDIFTDQLEIVIQRCATFNHRTPSIRQLNNAEVYNEVFSIAQFWGFGYYHHISEQVPRLVPYLPFLKKTSRVWIHVVSRESFVLDSLQALGIHKSRIIFGDIHAKVLYSPVGGKCGSSPLVPAQMLSLLLRQEIQSPPERRSIILIQRSYRRYFLCHNNVKDMLEEEASSYGLKLEVYGDRPLPSQKETAAMFNRAVMVVAPHGAGLSNMLYSEPGTIIIEGVCFTWFYPLINHCYEHSAFILGHRYVAINYPDKSCHYLQAADIKPVVKYFLHSLLLENGSKRPGVGN